MVATPLRETLCPQTDSTELILPALHKTQWVVFLLKSRKVHDPNWNGTWPPEDHKYLQSYFEREIWFLILEASVIARPSFLAQKRDEIDEVNECPRYFVSILAGMFKRSNYKEKSLEGQERICLALCQVLCLKREKCLLLPLMVLIIEDSEENTSHTTSITKKTHRSGSSPNLPKGSVNEIRSTNHRRKDC